MAWRYVHATDAFSCIYSFHDQTLIAFARALLSRAAGVGGQQEHVHLAQPGSSRALRAASDETLRPVTSAAPTELEPPSRVLFLDIDGVLNSHRTAIGLGGIPHDFDAAGLALFDLAAVGMLRGLCEAGNVSVVLSSSWRIVHDFRELGAALRLPIIDQTPRLVGNRGKEIAAWLAKHPEVQRFAIVDDDSDMEPEQRPFFVQTHYEDGLTWLPFLKLCDLFSVNPFDCGRARTRTPAPTALDWSAA